ncbi:unnamed protein product [Effrenium voratum]|nr:unnamed protein product [Effrenium voratum]
MPALVPQPWPAPQPLPSTRLAPQPQQQQPRQEQQRPSPEPAPAPQQPQQMQPPQVHQAAAALDRRLTAAELTVAGVLQQASGSLPEQSSVFCAWAVEHCMLADGYIPAVAQEVLLLLFLGERGAARLVAAAGQYRAATAEPLAHADAVNDLAAAPAAAAQQPAGERHANGSSAGGSAAAPTVPDTQLVEHRDNSTGQAGAAPVALTALPPGPPPNDASPDDILGGRSPAPAAEPSEPDEVDTAQPTRFLPLQGARLRAAFAAIDALDAETVLRGAPVPKQDFLARFDAFFRGEWQLLVNVAWLLLLYCASPRSNYAFRIIPPELTDLFAIEHDAAVQRCFSAMLFGEDYSWWAVKDEQEEDAEVENEAGITETKDSASRPGGRALDRPCERGLARCLAYFGACAATARASVSRLAAG